MNANEIGVIVSFIVGIAIMIGGLTFNKYSKSSEVVKRNVSIGAYLLGGISAIINGFQLLQIINGTFESSDLPRLPDLPTLPTLPDTTPRMIHTVELFGTSINLFNLINVGAGIVIILIGLMFKQKKWSKVVILLGALAIMTGALQIIL